MADDLAKLARRLTVLRARLMPQLASEVARSLKAATLWGYARRQDVNGKPYPLPKDGHRPPMLRSHTLRNSVNAGPVRRGGQWGGAVRTHVEGSGAFTGKPVGPYDEYLRSGTPKMAAREHLPSPGQTPPPRYMALLNANVGGELRNSVDRAVHG